ncbi:cytochrome c oxidase assembly protein [Sphingomonas ginkgonis]|nr:cytochrome c oxidase assembly protein [Sphingomonas ginkgonis]
MPPVPGELLSRWNLSPWLLLVLLAVAILQLRTSSRPVRGAVAGGWIVATLAFVSPLCALSVALFSARIAQHMLLMLVAAPLIALGLPASRWRHSAWWSALAFTAALWVWHMPAPYKATFRSDAVYWAMHLTLFGSAIWLWRDLLDPTPERAASVLGAGLFACIAMGFLGAVLTLANHPWFDWYRTTTEAWGLDPLADQQLGGAIMWVPGGIAFLAVALRSLLLVHRHLERPAAAR